jgi:hypothetical protein
MRRERRVGAISKVWPSCAARKALIARIASPPGRFSITTGRLHLRDALSLRTRAVVSTPLPGPSGKIHVTLRCGQDCAADCACAGTSAARTRVALIIKRRMDRSSLKVR